MSHLLWKPRTFMSPLFSELMNDDFLRSGSAVSKTTLPAVNIQETAEGWKLDLAVPGIPKEKIKIQLDNTLLTVSAEHTEEKTEEKPEIKLHRQEFGYFSFSRSFTLPENIQTDGITARHEDGVLKLFLPKRQTVKTEKQISIQ